MFNCHQGINRKDKEDLAFGLKQGVDWVALSFVRNPSDLIEIKDLIRNHGFDTSSCQNRKI